MKIKTIKPIHVDVNRFTIYGRKRNQAIQKMVNNGCKIIEEYKENCNSRVYFGYINQYVRFPNFVTRVERNGAFEEKYSSAKYSPIPSSAKIFYIERRKNDGRGHETISTQEIKIVHGNVVNNEFKITSSAVSTMKKDENNIKFRKL